MRLCWRGVVVVVVERPVLEGRGGGGGGGWRLAGIVEGRGALQPTDLPLELGERRGRAGHGREDEALLIVVFAEDLVVAQVELVAHAEPVVALLTSETLKVVHIVPGSHNHLKGGDNL